MLACVMLHAGVYGPDGVCTQIVIIIELGCGSVRGEGRVMEGIVDRDSELIRDTQSVSGVAFQINHY